MTPAETVAILRERDRPRYFAALFARPDLRRDLLTLYGTAAEIGRVPDHVREPGLGEIRLQWWADGLSALGTGADAPTPLLAALADVVRRHRLPVAPLAALADARRRDLYADPPADEHEVEGFLGETESVLFQLACLMAGASGGDSADAAGHAGIAYGLARRLAGFGRDLRRGRLILPRTLLQRHGLTPELAFAGIGAGGGEEDSGRRLAAAVAEAGALARRHLGEAEAALTQLPKALRIMFLPLTAVRPTLSRLQRMDAASVANAAELPDLRLLAAMAGRRLRLGGPA